MCYTKTLFLGLRARSGLNPDRYRSKKSWNGLMSKWHFDGHNNGGCDVGRCWHWMPTQWKKKDALRSCSTLRFAYVATGNFAKLRKQKIVCTCIAFLFSCCSVPVQCCSESWLDAFVHRLRECFGRVDISRLLHKKDRASKSLLYLSYYQPRFFSRFARTIWRWADTFIFISQDWLIR